MKYYGEKSIYMLKFELGLASQLITNGMGSPTETASQHISKMKDIVMEFHNNNPADL